MDENQSERQKQVAKQCLKRMQELGAAGTTKVTILISALIAIWLFGLEPRTFDIQRNIIPKLDKLEETREGYDIDKAYQSGLGVKSEKPSSSAA